MHDTGGVKTKEKKNRPMSPVGRNLTMEKNNEIASNIRRLVDCQL